MTAKIKIIRRTTRDGFKYSLADWPAYVDARRLLGLPDAAAHFHVSISFELQWQIGGLAGFDAHVPQLYDLPVDACEIVDGGAVDP
jgi:hypothetical protein